jgi:Matrixin
MRLTSLFVFACLGLTAAENTSNWSANYPPCNRHSELLKRGHMDLGVRFLTSNPALAEQFRRAMDSWAKILDLDWHEDDTQNCAIQVIDGERELFHPASVIARSQFPDRLDFQGWIAFNPEQTLDEPDLYRMAVHEIGHILGLPHSAKATSVMYFLDLDGLEWLDPTDLTLLAKHHKMRIADLDKPVPMAAAPVSDTLNK